MTFGDLQASILQDIFPEGTPENLVLSLNKFTIQAICDLQTAVACLRYGNTDFFPHCSTYFNCGMTVLPEPAGQILRVCTIGKKDSSGQAAGTSIADTTFAVPMTSLVNGSITTPTTSGTLCDIPSDGIYTVSVNATNSLKALYPANSPQYWSIAINYTDTSGNPQTVKPSPIIHVSDSGQQGSIAIDAKGGTQVTYVITPYNVPQTDGQISVELSLVTGDSSQSSDDWCSKVYYQQVEFSHIERYMRACNQCQKSSIWNVANAIAAGLFGHWRTKRRYNPPTDIGFENLPKLPPGFHYPQTSTDAGGRSRGGVWALKHGRIYIAPYIESTESVIVEWNGIKTNWAATDLVLDDPKFIEAIRLNVAIQHYTFYENNSERLDSFLKKYYGAPSQAGVPARPGVLRELITACRERNRIHTDAEVSSSDGDAAGGIGITTGTTNTTGIYYNAAQSCGTSTTIPAGAYSSNLSQADADAKAMAACQAQSQAQGTTTPPNAFLNVEQSYTASCPGASGTTPAAQGSSVTVKIPAGSYQSAISQALADAAALQAAQVQAQSQLACTYYNSPQTVNVKCGDNSTQSASIPAGQFTSTSSQADADQQAIAAAQAQASNQCPVNAGFVIGNTAQLVPFKFVIVSSCGTSIVSGSIPVPANKFMAQATTATQATVQAQLNAQAIASAQATFNALQLYYTNKANWACLHTP